MIQATQLGSTILPGPWRPLRNSTFRNLLVSNLVSDIGTFMQSVGAAWLMTSLTNNPLYIALIQTVNRSRQSKWRARLIRQVARYFAGGIPSTEAKRSENIDRDRLATLASDSTDHGFSGR
jgi:hypothetical protein